MVRVVVCEEQAINLSRQETSLVEFVICGVTAIKHQPLIAYSHKKR
jgi:hypothetical protein